LAFHLQAFWRLQFADPCSVPLPVPVVSEAAGGWSDTFLVQRFAPLPKREWTISSEGWLSHYTQKSCSPHAEPDSYGVVRVFVVRSAPLLLAETKSTAATFSSAQYSAKHFTDKSCMRLVRSIGKGFILTSNRSLVKPM